MTKNCQTSIEQTHTRPEETLELNMIKSRETIHFLTPISIEGSWMTGLTDLEVYNSVFNITEQNNKLQFFKIPDEKAGGVSYEKNRDEIGRDLDISDTTDADLQDNIIGPNIIEEYRKQVTKRMEDVGYMNILSGYPSSVFQDFESYLGTEIDLVKDNIRLVLDENKSSFVTYDLQPGFYTFKYLSEALFNILQTENPEPTNVIDIEYDDITIKTKFVVRPGFTAIKFDKKVVFMTILAFPPGWNYKFYNDYISLKDVNLSNTNNIFLKCDVIDGSILDGLRHPILFSFFLDKPAGYKNFCNPETIHFSILEQVNKNVLKTITFFR